MAIVIMFFFAKFVFNNMSIGYNPYNDSFNDDDDFFLDHDALLNQIDEYSSTKNFIYFDPEELAQSIVHFLNMDDANNASIINDYALKLFPDNTDFHLFKAEALLIKRKYSKAFSILESIEEIEPYNAKIYILKATMFFEKNMIDKAITEYHRALKNNIDDPFAIYDELAYCYLAEKKFNHAIECYKKCISYENDNPDPYHFLSEIYIKSDAASDGIFYFDTLINEEPDNINALLAIGKLFEHESMFGNALKAYNNILEIDEEHFEAISNKINLFKLQNDYNEVIKLYNQYKDLFYPFFKEELARTYEELDCFGDALDIYLTLLDEDKDDIAAIGGAANCFFMLGNYADTEKLINSGLSTFPKYTELNILKARLKYANNDISESLKILSEIFDTLSFDIFSENEFKISELLIEMRKFDMASEFLNAFINSDKFNAQIYFLLAAVNYHIFDYQNAYMNFESGLSLSFNDYNIFFNNCMIAHTDDFFYDLIEKQKKNI